MKPRTWVIIFAGVASSLLGVVAFLNWWVDPLWIYNHGHTPLGRKYGFDERLQKTISVKFGTHNYDAVLLGSSVATHINQNHFKQSRVFNFAASGMRPDEFAGYIEFFKREEPGNVTSVFVAADFLEYFDNDYNLDSPESYVERVSAPGYRIKELLSMSALSITFRAIRNQAPLRRYYEPGNVANIERTDSEALEQIIIDGLREEDFSNLVVDPDYESHLDEIIAVTGESNIIVFTTPISHFRTKLFFERGKSADYGEWLRLLVRKFGKVFHFSDINSVTSNHRKYYSDSYHFYPEVGDMIVRFIESDGEIRKDDFGVILTSETIDGYLHSFPSKSNNKNL